MNTQDHSSTTYGATNPRDIPPLTLAVISALAVLVPKPTRWKYGAVSPEQLAAVPVKSGAPCLDGIEIFLKVGQVSGVWLFNDRPLLQRYLLGELSELDLMGEMASGKCRPMKNVQ